MPTHRSFGEFANRMNFTSDHLVGQVQRMVRSVALAVHQTVVLGTPVDTGRARGNWFVSVGGAVFNNQDPTFVDQQASHSTRRRQATQHSLDQGAPVIATWRLGAGDIFVSNGVPYINSLDQGSSSQAPAGMVQRAVLAGRRVLKETKLLPPGTA